MITSREPNITGFHLLNPIWGIIKMGGRIGNVKENRLQILDYFNVSTATQLYDLEQTT
jgi:hypothetical protein